MKKLLMLTALSVMFSTTASFAICHNPSPNPYAYNGPVIQKTMVRPMPMYSRPVVTGYAAPIVNNPCCNDNPCGCKKKKNFFSRLWN